MEEWIEAELDRLPTFPCDEEKHPLLPWKRARPNRAWREWKRVGVPCGAASGFDCVDFDDVGWFHEWPLPASRTHETSRGFHVLFQHHPGMRPSNSRIAPGVDVKGDDSFCIWHPFEGRQVWWKDRLAEWPTFLLEKALNNGDGDHTIAGALHFPAYHGFRSPNKFIFEPTRNLRSRTKNILGKLERAPRGMRNETLYKAALTFRKMIVIEKLLKREIARQLLISACKVNGLLQEDRDGVLATITSAFEGGRDD